jgi:hypothetical protein
MKFDSNTVKRTICAVIATGVLMLGAWTGAQAQGRYSRYYGGQRNYGQQRRIENLERRDARHILQRHQRYERMIYRDRWGGRRDNDVDQRDWRQNRNGERTALRLHQRAERQAFKQTLRNRRRGY